MPACTKLKLFSARPAPDFHRVAPPQRHLALWSRLVIVAAAAVLVALLPPRRHRAERHQSLKRRERRSLKALAPVNGEPRARDLQGCVRRHSAAASACVWERRMRRCVGPAEEGERAATQGSGLSMCVGGGDEAMGEA
eukprot:356274-Chlamydomonas_euryale.AAC.4